jgi:DNA-binding SARP family transcriptional activator
LAVLGVNPYYLPPRQEKRCVLERGMSERYHLKLLGFPELRRPDGRPVKLKVRKHLALLIYLVVDAREQYYRDELAELLWPEVPEENSRHSLSMAFSVLRSLFGPTCVQGNHAVVRFAVSGLSLDLEQLERGDILGSETCPPLEVDGFLRDFHIEDAPAFQHWRDRRNAQLLPMMQAGILMLIDQARRSGDMPRIMALADRLLALDPLAEEGIRARMEAFAMQGDRVNALRIFESWKRQLLEELAATPSEILEGMATRLRCRGIEPATAFTVRETLSEPRFVGRAAEYQALFEAWESTIQLNTRHVLLYGESGIGKSTLAMRFASAAALEGAAVARVQCFELEQRIPFGMIGALVTTLLDRPAVMGTAPESLAEVARVIPKVRDRFPNLPGPRRSEGEAARLHFAEGTFAIFDAVMEEQPLVLIIDDYPRSDEASLSVLHMLLRRAANDRLMVVLSGRPPEPDEPAQAARIRKGVSYLPMQRVELPPLSDTEGDDLLRALLIEAGKEPAPPERRAILRTAGGNPMALELLTKDWITHGDAALAVLLPAMAEVPGSALEAIGYDRLIERIVPALAPRTRVALYLAAILGPRLNDLDCFQIIDFAPAQAMAALSELIECRVLRNTGRGLEFVNELIRARLYLKIPAAARVRLHNGVADRLLAAVAQGETIPGLEIAWHCIRSRRREAATPYLLRGARDAITHGAPDEAARALSSALAHLKGRAKAEATLLLAETYQEMGQWRDALDCIRTLSEEQKKDHDVREMADVLRVESEHQLDLYPLTEIPSVLQEIISKVLNYRDPAARTRAILSAAYIAATLRSEDLLFTVRDFLRNLRIDDFEPHNASRVLLARGMTNYHVREKASGREDVLRAASLLQSIQTTDSTFVRIQIGLGTIASAEGKYHEALEDLEAGYKAAARIDNAHLMTQAAGNLALSYHRVGMVHEHLKWAGIAWETARHSGRDSFSRLHAAARCAMAHSFLHHSTTAKEWLVRLHEIKQETCLDWVKQAAMLYEADVNWLLGQKSQALDIVRDIHTITPGPLTLGFVGSFARWTTVSATRTGKTDVARRLLRSWYEKLDRLDALDQAELLCGLAQLETPVTVKTLHIDDQARSALAQLPIACAKQMAQLGLRLPD